MDLSLFDYLLPEEQIAQLPAPRGTSRLLVLGDRSLTHRRIGDLPALLAAGDLLVVNDTRVLPCRLAARRRDTGGAVELLLIGERDERTWEALARPARRARPGCTLVLARDLVARVIASGEEGRRTLSFSAPVGSWLQQIGAVPLPPYIRRPPRPEDAESYQTIFARAQGAVAAPTAGLHFTPELVDRLRCRDIALTPVTLHVGPGTFRPVTASRVEEHRMEAERFAVSDAAVEAVRRTRARGGRVVAVGTTVVRTLESMADAAGGLRSGIGSTDLFIRPGHRFRIVDLLLTNFHLPRSTLLMLVAAFAGRERVLAAYRTAVASGYRFYSYGDAMLLAPAEAGGRSLLKLG